MSYSPHTPQDRAEMLAAIGVAGIEDLFTDVPAGVRFPKLNLPGHCGIVQQRRLCGSAQQ